MSAWQYNPDTTVWREVMHLYYEDKVEEALDAAQGSAGAFQGEALGRYRLIEGEAGTRRAGRRKKLTDRLELEWVPSEVPNSHEVGGIIEQAVQKVTQRLHWDGHESVLASILVAEADAPWNEARYGYCVDKVPYDKICLPQASTREAAELWQVAAHEFAHVVVLNTADKHAPHWLDEGIACLMEGRDPQRAKDRLRQWGVWLHPHELAGAFEVDRRVQTNSQGVGEAYDQATVLVGYLHSLGGDEGIVNLLKALPDPSHLSDFIKKALGGDPTDVSLHRIYSLSVEELFAKARE